MTSLHPDTLADLRKSGLADETIRVAGIYTATPGGIGKKLGGLGNDVVGALCLPSPRGRGFRALHHRAQSPQEPFVGGVR